MNKARASEDDKQYILSRNLQVYMCKCIHMCVIKIDVCKYIYCMLSVRGWHTQQKTLCDQGQCDQLLVALDIVVPIEIVAIETMAVDNQFLHKVYGAGDLMYTCTVHAHTVCTDNSWASWCTAHVLYQPIVE